MIGKVEVQRVISDQTAGAETVTLDVIFPHRPHRLLTGVGTGLLDPLLPETHQTHFLTQKSLTSSTQTPLPQ